MRYLELTIQGGTRELRVNTDNICAIYEPLTGGGTIIATNQGEFHAGQEISAVWEQVKRSLLELPGGVTPQQQERTDRRR